MTVRGFDVRYGAGDADRDRQRVDEGMYGGRWIEVDGWIGDPNRFNDGRDGARVGDEGRHGGRGRAQGSIDGVHDAVRGAGLVQGRRTRVHEGRERVCTGVEGRVDEDRG